MPGFGLAVVSASAFGVQQIASGRKLGLARRVSGTPCPQPGSLGQSELVSVRAWLQLGAPGQQLCKKPTSCPSAPTMCTLSGGAGALLSSQSAPHTLFMPIQLLFSPLSCTAWMAPEAPVCCSSSTEQIGRLSLVHLRSSLGRLVQRVTSVYHSVLPAGNCQQTIVLTAAAC